MRPKTVNYSDKELRKSIEHQLDYDVAVASNNIGVAVANGVATLTGYVENYTDKIAAEKAVMRCCGVKALANDIEVKTLFEPTDTDLAEAALHALSNNLNVPSNEIKVTVKNGCLTLTGNVDWGFQKEAAEQAVEYLFGVRGISNNIEVQPRVSSVVVHTRIEQALRRNAELSARGIRVTSHGGEVTLSGSVRSSVEKQEAEHATWGGEGVTSVINQIEIIT